MRRNYLLFPALLLIITIIPLHAQLSAKTREGIIDTIGRQILYNGRAWRNLYHRIKGDQFLFTSDFLRGTVSIDGKNFGDLDLKYDIYNDELILITDRGIHIELNKEMIDRFTIDFLNRTYVFKKLMADSVNSLSGYVNVLYDGRTSLYVRYRKEILLLAVDNKYDLFNQINKMYLEKNGIIEPINNKRQLLNLIVDKKEEVHTFIKSNRINLSRKNPDGYMPVVEYYNTITN